MKSKILFLCLVALMAPIGSPSYATPVPKTVIEALQRREDHFARMTFNWNVQYHQEGSYDQKEILVAEKAAAALAVDTLTQQGVTNKQEINKEVQRQINKAASRPRSYSYSSQHIWQIARLDDETLVTGVKQDGEFAAKYVQYYKNDCGIIDATEVYWKGIKGPGFYPDAWMSHGDSVRYRSLFMNNLELIPEHFALLACLNPLGIYNAQWKLSTSTPTELILTAAIKQNNFSPFHIRMTLSRVHGNVPSAIEVVEGHRTLSFHVQSFILYKNDWLCDKIQLSDTMKLRKVSEVFSLENISQSSGIHVRLPMRHAVNDYRLLGPDLPIQGVGPGLSEQQKRGVAHYSWSGHFPSLATLQRTTGYQHTSSSALSRHNLVIWMYGALLIVAGCVWYALQRHSLQKDVEQKTE